MPARLNDLTQDELQNIRDQIAAKRAANQRPTLFCAFCDKTFTERKRGQKFCAPRCRSAYGHAVTQLTLDRHAVAQSRWEEERSELLREIAGLRREIEALHQRED